ncbi:MAG: hypothetical protein R6U96_02565 [Promethearchaeia archaeon]
MKSKYTFIIGFLLVSTLAFGVISVLAADYSVAVEEGDEAVREVVKVDEDVWNDIYSSEYDEDEMGAEGEQSKAVITDVDENSDEVIVTYNYWNWTDEEFAADPDDEENMNISLVPENATEEMLIPTPAADYIQDIADSTEETSDNVTAEVDDLTLTIEYDLEYFNQTINFIKEITYNEDGVQENIKIMDIDENIAYEAKLVAPFIPGFPFPVFLGVSAVATIGLIYTIMKRRM